MAKQDGQYTQYIFKNLEENESSLNRYLMVTKCPNWQGQTDLSIGMTGFLTFEPVSAGDSYYDVSKDINSTYKYTGCYFISFVKAQTEDNNIKEFKF